MSSALDGELIVDNFAGGGGASTGIEAALGRAVDIAINHDPEAIALHRANHPATRHYCEDVFSVDPLAATGGRPVGLAWFSPDCKHFSKAKGGKPVSKKIRGLAWVVIKWARTVKPRVIMLENVEEFETWGPLTREHRPCPQRRGLTYRRWLGQLQAAGYRIETRVLRACDYGAPTIRKRLFLIARCDGRPIVWPSATHGAGLKPFRTAAECIDWSLPCPSIFERTKPLKPATLQRIVNGLRKFVIDCESPFVIPLTHQGGQRGQGVDAPISTITSAQRGELALVTPFLAKFRFDSPGQQCDKPLHTITAGGDMKRPAGAAHAMGIVCPTLIQTGYGERKGQAPRSLDLHRPLGTVVSGQKHAVVTAFLAKHFSDRGQRPGSALDESMSTITSIDHHSLVTAQLVGCGGRAAQSRPRDASEPAHTLTAKADACLVASHLVKLKGTSKHGQALSEPLHTVHAGGTHYAEVRALLADFLPADSPSREGTVTHQGASYAIVDIGMRMLQPHELFAAQGFPGGYVIAPEINGKRLSKTAQVRMCGNSVCPPMSEALVRANFADMEKCEAAA